MTLYASNVARSKAFYQRLTGLPIQAEDKDFCEFRLEGGFLGIYAPDAGQQPGFNHFCFGVDAYNPQAALTALNVAAPEAKPALENQDQDMCRIPTASGFNSRTCATSVNANRWASNQRLLLAARLRGGHRAPRSRGAGS